MVRPWISLLKPSLCLSLSFFFFNDTATTEIYTLSLHDALPISDALAQPPRGPEQSHPVGVLVTDRVPRSGEHTSELQSLRHLVCRLLLEKKKTYLTSHPRLGANDNRAS